MEELRGPPAHARRVHASSSTSPSCRASRPASSCRPTCPTRSRRSSELPAWAAGRRARGGAGDPGPPRQGRQPRDGARRRASCTAGSRRRTRTKAETDANYKRLVDWALDPDAHRGRADRRRQPQPLRRRVGAARSPRSAASPTASSSRCCRAWRRASRGRCATPRGGCCSTRRWSRRPTSTPRSPTSSGGFEENSERRELPAPPVRPRARRGGVRRRAGALRGGGRERAAVSRREPRRRAGRAPAAGRVRERARHRSDRPGGARGAFAAALAAPPVPWRCPPEVRRRGRRRCGRASARRARDVAARPRPRSAARSCAASPTSSRRERPRLLAVMAHEAAQDGRRGRPRGVGGGRLRPLLRRARARARARPGAAFEPLGVVARRAAVELPAGHPGRRRARRAGRGQRRDPQAGAADAALGARAGRGVLGGRRPARRAPATCAARTAGVGERLDRRTRDLGGIVLTGAYETAELLRPARARHAAVRRDVGQERDRGAARRRPRPRRGRPRALGVRPRRPEVLGGEPRDPASATSPTSARFRRQLVDAARSLVRRARARGPRPRWAR